MKNQRLIISILSMFLAASYVFSQQDSTLTKKELRAAKKAQKIADGKMIISPIVGPGFTPELQFVIGGGGIISWTNNKTDKSLPRSNMPVNLTLSSTGAVVINLRPTTFWRSDKLRINGDVWYKAMPDHYWGKGYDKAYLTPESDSTTRYFRDWFQFRGDAIYRIKGDLLGGITFDVNYTKGSDEAELILQDEVYLKYNERPFNVGFGPVLTYDSRDVPVNAWKGLYLNGSAVFYSRAWGGDNRYQLFTIDYRQYQSINRQKGRTLAWQIKARLTFGDVPYGEMSQLGNPFDLRGYYWGKYRDKSMMYFIGEYRHMFLKTDGELSRHGFVAWMGTGSIFDLEESREYHESSKWLPNLGLGYRFELQPRLNLRIDIGMGRESSGFYFNMNEAF